MSFDQDVFNFLFFDEGNFRKNRCPYFQCNCNCISNNSSTRFVSDDKFSSVQPNEICAGKPDINDQYPGLVDGGPDSCKGDSGGPLICVRDGKPELTGITSWGYGCSYPAGSPGVFANVFSMFGWIQNHVTIIERKYQNPGNMNLDKQE